MPQASVTNGARYCNKGYARWNMGLTSDYSETEFGFSPDDPFACFECDDFIQRNLVVL